MFHFSHIMLLLLSVLYSLSNFAQTSERSKCGIDKLVAAKDQVAFNTFGNFNGVKYSDINGSPFWRSDFLIATFYIDNTKIGTAPAKMNFLTNEVYFMKGKEEFVLDERAVNKIIFEYAGDTTTFIRGVPNLFLDKRKVDDFVQVMNKGRYQFI